MDNMVWRLRLNGIVVLMLGAFFCYFFNLAKHSPALAPIIPFDNDPYDAVGSFGAIMSVVLGIVVAVRALRIHGFCRARQIFLNRAQMAIVLVVLITMACDAIAMARHPSMWMGRAGTNELLAFMIGLSALAMGMGFVAWGYFHQDRKLVAREQWHALAASSTFLIVLGVFPDGIIRSVPGEVLALASGIVLLLWPLSALSVALIPYEADVADEAASIPTRARPLLCWAGVIFLGAAIGTCLLLLEAKSGIPADRLAMVAVVFIGSGIGGLAIAYAFLKEPLGLFR